MTYFPAKWERSKFELQTINDDFFQNPLVSQNWRLIFIDWSLCFKNPVTDAEFFREYNYMFEIKSDSYFVNAWALKLGMPIFKKSHRKFPRLHFIYDCLISTWSFFILKIIKQLKSKRWYIIIIQQLIKLIVKSFNDYNPSNLSIIYE